ncbi:MAG: hypothetical protein HN742_16035 [Lentisphaerae bacterium]|nr:hypothetical protein [Lentisphaerota bacterium]MBT4823239.1 hypothetical protein [Lentisphaerota bacterium]MBT5604799.1 hypothetical protein [Lentisphaerota bacterium]MBT7053550.1 hypothetical protein [Lentisphaerota bacterium]MBT7843387.1 hypothetical protein [Lentisphaerota bacterium]
MIGIAVGIAGTALGQTTRDSSAWDAPDRAAKVAALIPGRSTPKYTPDTLFTDWTQSQIERWDKAHPTEPAENAYRRFAETAPADAELIRDFPRHISPFGRLRGDQGEKPSHHLTGKADKVLVTYCPVCGSKSMKVTFDPGTPYTHASTSCCRTDLYANDRDWPPDSPLTPNATVVFPHLDDTSVDVPCTRYTDSEGIEWELFIPTIFAHHRWLEQGCQRVRQHMKKFQDTADPLFVHKIAVVLNQVADTYYGLPLASNHRLCNGKDGKPLTRAEWEVVPRPAIFKVSYLGPWGRRKPYSSPGWLNMMDEHIWVEPFARTRHHPAFKEVSRQLYGDPEALDRKIMTKLMRELSLMFQSVFSQKLLHNYQEAIYIDLWLLGVLLQERVLIDFAGPCQELSMYNHTYQDGMNGEGAPNYQAMPGGYYFPVLKSPKGWLQYQPDFLERNPFYWAASSEMYKSKTVRGLSLEWGDQHEHVFATHFTSDAEQVRDREKVGSRNWAGYGIGVLRVGGAGHRQEVSLGYTRAALHNAQDAMSMECWVDGVPVMRRGGYAAWWCGARLQWDRPEYQALRQMGYPHAIEEADYSSFDSWSWVWAHSPMNQNGLTIDGVATGKGWGDNRGYGECITFKGGEDAGSPGSGFQVLDVKDHYSWARVDKDVTDWRRIAIGVEGPDGRPYVLDITNLTGGKRHALYNQAWAQRADEDLPKASGEAPDLGSAFFGDELPEDTPDYRNYTKLRNLKRFDPDGPAYGVTWEQDYGAWGNRDPNGKPYQRPVPDDVGKVRLRFIGLNQDDRRTELLSGKGPWIGWLRQALPNRQQVNGNVSFVDARDFLIESRTGGTEDIPLRSSFVHILEGFREGESSVIAATQQLPVKNVEGPARQIVALELSLTAGHTDTVIYQSESGTVELPDGTRTDARYALVRRDTTGQVIATDAVRCTTLVSGGFSATMPGDFTGTIVDVIGDITGTRQESAVVIRPDSPWPIGTNLHDHQLNIRIESDLRAPCDEGYRVARTTLLDDGFVRIDLQDYAPFAVSWHEVTELPTDQPNAIRTWRPMVDHANGPWYGGMKLWFPERGKTYTMKAVNAVGGGHGGDRVELVEDVDLQAEGIKPGDWYVIYGVRPGLKVRVANDLAWRREPATDWQQYSLRATGTVTIADPALSAGGSYQIGDGLWQDLAEGTPLTVAAADRNVTQVMIGKPDWLNLNDSAPPDVIQLTLDGQQIDPAKAADLGWIEPPKQAVISLRDAGNPLDRVSLKVTLNRRSIDESNAVQTTFGEDGGRMTVVVDLARVTAADQGQPRRHTLTVAVNDQSVGRHEARVTLSYLAKMPLDPEAVYLSDLKRVKAFAHGGPNIDKDYKGGVATIGDRVYPKCLMVCPEPSAEGAHGEVVLELPADAPRILHSDIGIEDMAGPRGTVVFMVQRSASPAGPWETLYTSPTVRGGTEPVRIDVELGNARFLRLYTTDAGDGINSDHALWGNARLK